MEAELMWLMLMVEQSDCYQPRRNPLTTRRGLGLIQTSPLISIPATALRRARQTSMRSPPMRLGTPWDLALMQVQTFLVRLFGTSIAFARARHPAHSLAPREL